MLNLKADRDTSCDNMESNILIIIKKSKQNTNALYKHLSQIKLQNRIDTFPRYQLTQNLQVDRRNSPC